MIPVPEVYFGGSGRTQPNNFLATIDSKIVAGITLSPSHCLQNRCRWHGRDWAQDPKLDRKVELRFFLLTSQPIAIAWIALFVRRSLHVYSIIRHSAYIEKDAFSAVNPET